MSDKLALDIAKTIDRYHAEHPNLRVSAILKAFDKIASAVNTSKQFGGDVEAFQK